MNVNQQSKKEEIFNAYKEQVDANTKLTQLLETLVKKVEALEQNTSQVAKVEPTATPSSRLQPNDFVTVISLVNGKLNLKVDSSSGRNTSFNGFGQEKTLIYSEVREILNNNRRFYEAGYFYIPDKKVIEENGLQYTAEKILSKEKMLGLINLDLDSMVAIFESATAEQQTTMVEMIVKKLADGESLDLNKVYKLSDVYGKDLNEMAKDIKFIASQTNVR